MLREKTKTASSRSSTSKQPSKHNTIKFTLSFDNLRPFVQSSRTPPKRPKYKELRSQRSKPLYKTEESENNSQNLRVYSPDVVREASNVILKAIETKGIGCVWEDLEEVRS